MIIGTIMAVFMLVVARHYTNIEFAQASPCVLKPNTTFVFIFYKQITFLLTYNCMTNIYLPRGCLQ